MIFTTARNPVIIASVFASVLVGTYLYHKWETTKLPKYALIMATVFICGFCILHYSISNKTTEIIKLYEHPAIVKFYQDSATVTDYITKETKSYNTVSEYNFLKNDVKIVYYNRRIKIININAAEFSNVEQISPDSSNLK